jgi:hypothetical protein
MIGTLPFVVGMLYFVAVFGWEQVSAYFGW